MNCAWLVALALTMLAFVGYTRGVYQSCRTDNECTGVNTYCFKREECACKKGWEGRKKGDRFDNHCPNDYDECYWADVHNSNLIGCRHRGPHIKCVNTIGSFKCFCNDGYEGAYPKCIEINECAEDSPCPLHSTCKNTVGSYLCICDKGYKKSPVGLCLDIDECKKENLNDCHELARCINKPATFGCKCRKGYYGDGRMTKKGCLDINECKRKNHGCHRRAFCINRPGYYKCICRLGYKGNGRRCTKIKYPATRRPTPRRTTVQPTTDNSTTAPTTIIPQEKQRNTGTLRSITWYHFYLVVTLSIIL